MSLILTLNKVQNPLTLLTTFALVKLAARMAPPSSWSKVDQVSTHERLEGAELILKSMFLDQREHIYANFGDTFLKVYLITTPICHS